MPNKPGDPITAFIGLGSNLDNPRARVEKALVQISALPETRVDKVSSLYLSAPYGVTNQPDFVNAVARVATYLDARSLFGHLQAIENSLGRVRTQHWGPRVIDLDLLVYGSDTIRQQDLTVPHPGIGDRNFVLLPLKEIAPDLEIPGLGRVSELAVDRDNPRIARLE